MSAAIPITVGTASDWAPPKLVGVEVDSDLVITNIERVTWQIIAGGYVSRAAAACRGEWFEIRNFSGHNVAAGDSLSIEPGGLRLQWLPEPLDDGGRRGVGAVALLRPGSGLPAPAALPALLAYTSSW